MAVKAVVLAAGSGTRMKSRLPKVVHRLAGKPMVQWVLDALGGLQPQETIVVVQPGADLVVATLPQHVTVAVQREQMGTGHATRVALDVMAVGPGDQLVVLPADTPLLTTAALLEMLAIHRRTGSAATFLSADVGDPGGYGRVVRDGWDKVTRIVEHKDATATERKITEINGGVYVFDGELVGEALSAIGTDNSQGEYYLPDVVSILVEAGHTISAHKTSEEELSGVNSQDQLAEVASVIRQRINRDWMRAGVWMKDPSSVYIDAQVSLEAGVALFPGVHLEGDTSIDAGSEIGPDGYLRDTDVGSDAKIWYAVIRQASIGTEAEVGPYVSLRPGAQLLDGSKAGTFVEMKNAILREGAKANHLAYLGDADIGEQANIGAGTITVNYDGYEKHRTVVGKGAKIGSNTMLVAPVEIGEGAFTGAGSVITKDVSDGALAIERSTQTEIPGYAARRHERHQRKKAD